MDIQLEKLELIKLLAETNDESIIRSIKSIFNKKQKDFWNDLTEEQKFEIEEGERQIEHGEFILFEDLIKKYK
ncbi:hypothetical protein B6A10_03435 [Flavobacterium sp. L1I52]|uniref:Addiction module component n=1 Tax=Flavobacterium pokkalii TaxID=1940408 RepID=A0ABR7UNA4_9FLAO|nr:hypothetical protein [Flavobacterium pokkalii]KQB38137.1 hypothetical protein RCH33_2482 [Flavobacterium daejeonense]MBD0724224.1 hypothetical protein [Flavobacterium pokkalii]